MTASIDNDLAIHGRRVPDDERISMLPRYFGARALLFENSVFNTIGALCKDYHGGYWDFFELSNGGFYMAPQRDCNMRIAVDGNAYEGDMSPDAAGIVACLYVLNGLAWRFQDESSINLYHWLRDYALDHDEAGEIFSAID